MRMSLTELLFLLAAVCCAVAQIAIFRSTAATRAAATSASGMAGRKSAADIVWVVLPAIALAIVLWFTWRAIHIAP
ncbi:MAG TPA: hypothetical protein VIC55_04715 [Gemmatimonadaceae bacterium]